MARSDLLINLVQAGASGNQALLKRTVEALIAEERAKHHHVLADSLSKFLLEIQNVHNAPSTGSTETRQNGFLLEESPQRKFVDLILDETVLKISKDLVEEHHRSDLLRSYNLEPRNKILLVGPPGNGKTSFAEALAEGLMVPLLTVRYHAVIGSYLGETAVRLKNMFDFVRNRKCLLFFDEFETVAKERGDLHETGEIKRVVSSLLLEMDTLPSYVVVVTATNHPELLDRAVWRRFQVRIMLPKPSGGQTEEWLRRFEKRTKQSLGYSIVALASKLKGLSFAEIEDFGNDVLRRFVLSTPGVKFEKLINENLVQLRLRAEASRSGQVFNGS